MNGGWPEGLAICCMRGIKNVRLPEYDYRSDGYYFITIVTRFRQPFFGLSEKSKICEKMVRDAIGKIQGVRVDTMIIMPDHVHMIIVLRDVKIQLGECVRIIKARTSYEFHERLWQPNYYEHVIRTEQALGNIRANIINNPNKEPTFSKRELKNGNIYLP